MSDAPGSYFVIDPGRTAGFAYCLAGGEKIRHGTWRFTAEDHGEAYAEFATYLKRLLAGLPDPQLGMEMMTVVAHGEDAVIDPHQIAFSAGWQAIAKTVCFSMKLRPAQLLAIGTWRSKTHGKTRVPDSMKGARQADKSKWLKQQAKTYCDRNGWSYNTDDEAEALCMLDALRIIHEPAYAFDRGKSYQQESFL